MILFPWCELNDSTMWHYSIWSTISSQCLSHMDKHRLRVWHASWCLDHHMKNSSHQFSQATRIVPFKCETCLCDKKFSLRLNQAVDCIRAKYYIILWTLLKSQPQDTIIYNLYKYFYNTFYTVYIMTFVIIWMQMKHYKKWYLITIGRDRSPALSNVDYVWNSALHRNVTECLLIVITQCYAQIWQPNPQIQIQPSPPHYEHVVFTVTEWMNTVIAHSSVHKQWHWRGPMFKIILVNQKAIIFSQKYRI